MDAEHARAALEREHVRRERPREPFRPRCGPADAREKALARRADHDRPAERDDLVEATDQREVVLIALAEADPRVEQHALLAHAFAHGELQASGEERLDLVDDVVVARVVLHRARLAEHVHQAAVGAALGDDAGHLAVAGR